MGAPLQSFYPPSVYGVPTSVYPYQQPGAFPGPYGGGGTGGGAAGTAGAAGGSTAGGNFYGERSSYHVGIKNKAVHARVTTSAVVSRRARRRTEQSHYSLMVDDSLFLARDHRHVSVVQSVYRALLGPHI